MGRLAPALLLALLGSGAVAQSPDPSGLSIEQLRRLVAEQQAQLERQRSQLEQQATTLQHLLERLDQLESGEVPAGAAPVDPGAQRDVAGTEVAQADAPATEAPPTTLGPELNINSRQENESVQGDFPGAIELPGTRIAMRPGGFVGFNLVNSSTELGVADRFITAFIPVGEGNVQGGGGASVSARNSRLNLEVRHGSDLGEFRAFVEGDFLGVNADGSDSFRLRHAFGQYRSLTIGQTWSTFVNPFTGPEDIDLEGINADVLVRQPLARWERNVNKGKVAVSLEEPVVSATGGTGTSSFWDLIGRYTGDGDRSFYIAGLVRQLGIQPVADPDTPPLADQDTFGWGLTGGMNFSLAGLGLGPKDGFQFTTTVGRGVARYVNDLDAAGGLDAYLDSSTGRIESPFSASAMASYRHFWNFTWRDFRTMRSTFTLGLVHVHYPSEVEDDFFQRTLRSSVNLLWSPLAGIDLGVEFLYGRRTNVDGESGTATQIQFATFYRF